MSCRGGRGKTGVAYCQCALWPASFRCAAHGWSARANMVPRSAPCHSCNFATESPTSPSPSRRRRRQSYPYMSPSSPSSNCRYSLRQSINSSVPSTHSSLSGSQVSAMGSWCSHRTRYSLTSRIRVFPSHPVRSRLTHLWSTMRSTTYSIEFGLGVRIRVRVRLTSSIHRTPSKLG